MLHIRCEGEAECNKKTQRRTTETEHVIVRCTTRGGKGSGVPVKINRVCVMFMQVHLSVSLQGVKCLDRGLGNREEKEVVKLKRRNREKVVCVCERVSSLKAHVRILLGRGRMLQDGKQMWPE